MLERGQSSWWGESTQHRGKEEGVGGHWVPTEVPSPRCWAGAAVTGHAKQQSQKQADSLAGSSSGKLRRASGCPSLRHRAWAQRGFGWSTHPPFCPGAAVQDQQANRSLLETPL